jgi:hypothetical protein
MNTTLQTAPETTSLTSCAQDLYVTAFDHLAASPLLGKSLNGVVEAMENVLARHHMQSAHPHRLFHPAFAFMTSNGLIETHSGNGAVHYDHTPNFAYKGIIKHAYMQCFDTNMHNRSDSLSLEMVDPHCGPKAHYEIPMIGSGSIRGFRGGHFMGSTSVTPREYLESNLYRA